MSVSSTSDSSTDCSPLSLACIKALTDKVDTKRKLAASEIEKMTAEFSMSNNFVMINRLITVLTRKFCLSYTPNSRKGGILGLAAVMVGFKNGAMIEPPPEIVEEVVRPVLTCFLDADAHVRYFACESLYNILKVAQGNSLSLFEDIFDALAKVVADRDSGVRNGAEILDRLLKDIVNEQPTFDIKKFVPRLEEYVYTKNPFTRMFIISWIRLIDSKVNMVSDLPILLDGIFNCLYDSTEEIRASTMNLLSEFLNKVVACPTDKVDIPSLLKIALKHAQKYDEDVVQYTAIAWLRQLISLLDSQDLISFSRGILSAILPCLAFQASSPDGSVISARDRFNPNVYRSILSTPSRGNICEISSLVNSQLLDQVTIILKDRQNVNSTETGDIEQIIEVLIDELRKQDHPVIKLAILDWFRKLNSSKQGMLVTCSVQDKLFQSLLDTLSNRSDAVVKNTLRVISDAFCYDTSEEQQQHLPQSQIVSDDADDDQVVAGNETPDTDKKKSPTKSAQLSAQKGSSTPSKKVAIVGHDANTSSLSGPQYSRTNTARFIRALCTTFSEREFIFEERGTFIILNLCSMMKPDVVYKTFAEILKEDKIDLRFTCKLVQKLNQILFTTQPLFGLRSRLSNSDDDPEVTAVFHSLYYAWCHSPIAALALCLLTNNYRHASEIVIALSQTDINLDVLTQIDWLVQLIESPVFASLRMRLLDSNSNQYLLLSLYGLLMILPQSEAYKRLSHRLEQVSRFMSSQQGNKGHGTSGGSLGSSGAGASSSGQTSTSSVHKQISSGTGSKDQMKKIASSTNLESLMKHYNNIQSQLIKLGRISGNDD